MTLLTPVLDALRGKQLKATVVLLNASWLLLVWKYFCTRDLIAGQLAASHPGAEGLAIGAIVQFLSGLVLMGLLPVVVIKLVFRERLADYGLGLGHPVRTVCSFFVLLPVFLLAAYSGARDPSLADHFPLNPFAGRSALYFAVHAITYLAYYFGWEIFFRGWMLFGLREIIGDTNAVLVQTLASSLLHIGSPAGETFGAILGGLLWGVLALWTRSILAGLGQHYALGITLDALLCLGFGVNRETTAATM